MGIKLTEEQLKKLLNKNPALKVAQSIGANIKDTKLSLDNLDVDKKKVKENKVLLDFGAESIKKQTKKSSDVQLINMMNQESTYDFSYSETHFSILFHNSKLLSVNQIFAILQSGKYKIFSYKKRWHTIIHKVLYEAYIEARSQGKSIPFFSENAELTLFRQAKRLVDEDAMTTMFKYIIDGLKKNINTNPYGILADDNPKIIHKIICHSSKGEPKIGIRIKLCEDRKQVFFAEDILKK